MLTVGLVVVSSKYRKWGMVGCEEEEALDKLFSKPG